MPVGPSSCGSCATSVEFTERVYGPREALRRHVLEHSLKTGNFTLKSGRQSNWFLDTKQTALSLIHI